MQKKENLEPLDIPASPRQSRTGEAVLIVLFIIGIFVAAVAKTYQIPISKMFSEAAWLAVKYEVQYDHVNIEPLPHDCEYDAVPYGKKYCHYEEVVTPIPDNNGKTVQVEVSQVKKTE